MKYLCSLVLLVAACGDNNTRPDARDRIDGAFGDGRIAKPVAIAVAGDFNSPGAGLASKLAVDSLTMQQNVVASAVQGDPVVRYHDGKLYVVNRFGGNNVTIIDGKTLQVIEQLASGPSSNPQDVAVVGSKLYVPAQGTSGVVVLNRGSTVSASFNFCKLSGESRRRYTD